MIQNTPSLIWIMQKLMNMEEKLDAMHHKLNLALQQVDSLPDAWGEELLQVQTTIEDIQQTIATTNKRGEK